MLVPAVLFAKGVHALAATAGFTGAAPQTVNGPSVNMNEVRAGTLSAHVKVLADTNTLTITAKWQGLLKDGATWVDICNEPQNPAGVALATGTAGADTATERILPAPTAVYAYNAARVVFTSGVGSGGGVGVDDVEICEYYYLKPGLNG